MQVTFVMLLGLWAWIPATTYAQTVITRSIATGSDDAEEEGPTGTTPNRMWLTSSDIELVSDFDAPTAGVQKIGLRFTTMTIPQGAVITSAYLTFRAVAADPGMTNNDPTDLTIRAQLIVNAPTFTTTSGDISARTLTSASASWVPSSWSTGSNYNSPSMVSVIQEVVNQGSWASGNAVAIIITGTGHRASQAYDTDPSAVAKLTVTYVTNSISGTVFEDVNYGGGAGRNWATASGSGGSARSAARVELFDNAGVFVTSTTTDGSGSYSFPGLGAANYTVRVVSDSVTSSRAGYAGSLRPVMTFRTDASSGTAADVTDHVGGYDPATVDAGKAATGWTVNSSTGVFTGSGSGKAHAFAPVTISTASVTGVDFGWNFDTIVNTNDSGQGSLRQFITNANALGGDASLAQAGLVAAKENAVFMISNGTAAAGLRATNDFFVGGAATITAGSALPSMITPLVLDARNQPGWVSTPIIEVNGGSIFAATDGLTIKGGSSIVRALIVNGFWQNGVVIDSLGGNTIAGCYLGLGPDGATVKANFSAGVVVKTESNQIGGTSAGDGNVISGNTGGGITCTGSSATGNGVYGNQIGTDANGVLPRGNSGSGVLISGGANRNTIGGMVSAATNVISANGTGITIIASDTTAILGNVIGTDGAGLADLGNSQDGISILSDASNNTVGGLAAGSRNIISGNGSQGIMLDGPNTTGNVILGNYIGVDSTGTAALPNDHDGIILSGSTHGNVIGGTGTGAGNVVAFNKRNGVLVSGSTSDANAILGNATFSNTGLGIDLGYDGVTANDGAKSAGQPNQLMDSPVFTSATLDGTTLTIAGYVGSAPGQAIFANSRVEIFKADSDTSSHGEGQFYFDFLTTDASGNFSGGITVTGIAGGDSITATATDESNNTSEFGANTKVDSAVARQLVKRAFESDGTPLASGVKIPRGKRVKFLIYLDNSGAAATDVSVRDVLDASFLYVAESMKVDDTLLSTAVCPSGSCDEGAIFSQVDNSGTSVGDGVLDSDVASYTAGPPTLDIGNGNNPGNTQLDVPAGRVWALVFTVRMQ